MRSARCSVWLFVLALPAVACAELVLDQESPWPSEPQYTAGFNMSDPLLNWQQGVTVGAPGPLLQIALYVLNPGSAILTLNTGQPWQVDAPEFSRLISFAAPGWNSVDVSDSGLLFAPGDQFALGIVNTGGGLDLGGSAVLGSENGLYAGGQLWVAAESTTFLYPDYDLAFRTYVPEPASLPGVLLSLVIARRR